MCCNRAGGGRMGREELAELEDKKKSRGSIIGRPEIKICVEMGDELENT